MERAAAAAEARALSSHREVVTVTGRLSADELEGLHEVASGA